MAKPIIKTAVETVERAPTIKYEFVKKFPTEVRTEVKTEAIEAAEGVEAQEAKTEFVVSTKVYLPGDACDFTDQNVIEYLLTNKIIK